MAYDFRQLIYGVLNHSYKFYEQDQRYIRNLELGSFQMSKVEPYAYEVVLRGSDYFGTWVGEGKYGLNCFWFRKIYDDSRRAGKAAVIYESKSIEQNRAEGIYFEDNQSRENSG